MASLLSNTTYSSAPYPHSDLSCIVIVPHYLIPNSKPQRNVTKMMPLTSPRYPIKEYLENTESEVACFAVGNLDPAVFT